MRRLWKISFNMHQLVVRCVCITLVLHGIGLAATRFLGARGPTPAQMGLYYYSSAFALIAYAAAVTLIVRVRSSGAADPSPPQHTAASYSVRCNTVVNGAVLAAACGGPPLLLFFLVTPVPATAVVLACLTMACVLGVGVSLSWRCRAAGAAAADAVPTEQFLSSAAGAKISAQVLVLAVLAGPAVQGPVVLLQHLKSSNPLSHVPRFAVADVATHGRLRDQSDAHGFRIPSVLCRRISRLGTTVCCSLSSRHQRRHPR